ncbi:MAG: molybdopterin-dependent oxidoreductase [Candidatus Eremiobacteraeota bacterium]|nr:molybdopterin-dependent oxidoreductase [Candidatus Eremiobacteraeota bacterium]
MASSLASLGLTGCGFHLGNRLNDTGWIHDALGAAQPVDRALIGTHGMAKLYRESDVDRQFRVNGFDTPHDASYTRLLADDFGSYRLVVDGMVDRPQAYSLSELRAFPLQMQITRHDCVEGWSAIGKWRGIRLADLLAAASPRVGARYAVFHCMDRSDDGSPYYESLDLHQAAHPQTLAALELNDRPLDPDHGAPVRIRVPTQLGYKSAKWVRRIEVVAAFNGIFGGKGGYWEDNGYEWYAGI